MCSNGRFRSLRPGEVHPRHRVRTCTPPWAGAAGQATSAAGSLHNQIWDFAAYISLRDSEPQARSMLLKRVASITTQLWPGSEISLFGSSANQLDWFGSDIDCTVVVPGGSSARDCCVELAEQLRSCRWAAHLEARDAAFVPIVCFEDRNTGVQVDVGFERPNQLSSSRITQLVHGFRPQDCTQFQALMLTLKVVLRQHGLDKPFHGGLGSFKLGALMAQYLVQSFESTPPDNGQVLKGFLNFLINFNFRHTIYLNTGDRVNFGANFSAANLQDSLRALLAHSENNSSGTTMSHWIEIGPLVKERTRSLNLAKEDCEQLPAAQEADDLYSTAFKRKPDSNAQFAPPPYKEAKATPSDDPPEICIAYE